LVQWHEDLRNIAVWTHLQGCQVYEGTRAGDTLTENRPNGWLWFIPLSDQTVSVGYVTSTKLVQESKSSMQELFESELAASEEVRRLTEGATRVAGFRTTRDWSDQCSRLWGPGWALVGDAAAFVYPLMSSGVGISLRAAKGLSETIDWILRNPEDEARVMDTYERDYQRFVGDLLEFIRFFYDRPATARTTGRMPRPWSTRSAPSPASGTSR